MKLAIAALAVLMFIPAAKADSSPPPPLEVTFTDVFTGPSGETETFSGSFEWQPVPIGGVIIPGSVQDSASGFLGNSTLTLDTSVLNAFLGPGIEIDMFLLPTVLPNGSIDLSGSFFLFGCYSTDCFGSLLPNGTNPGAYEFPESATFSASAMPEPSLLAMLFLGILPLAFIKRRSWLS
jgi:hypothetical protein